MAHSKVLGLRIPTYFSWREHCSTHNGPKSHNLNIIPRPGSCLVLITPYYEAHLSVLRTCLWLWEKKWRLLSDPTQLGTLWASNMFQWMNKDGDASCQWWCWLQYPPSPQEYRWTRDQQVWMNSVLTPASRTTRWAGKFSPFVSCQPGP